MPHISFRFSRVTRKKRTAWAALNAVLWLVRYSPLRKQSHRVKDSQSENRFWMVLVNWNLLLRRTSCRNYSIPQTSVINSSATLIDHVFTNNKIQQNCWLRRVTWGFTVLRYWFFFSCGISVILILTCGIAVSSSSAVCGFLHFGWRYSVK